ncbi:MAG: preprotein translocase subunit SecG [Thermoguttaceae bacterium]
MLSAILQSLLFIFMVILSLFLILIILLQRGKGGGLVGAFGGMGGSSMFGTKTSDVFLKITIWTTVVWFVTCFGGRYILSMKSGNSLADRASENALTTPAPTTGSDLPALPNAEPSSTGGDAPAAEGTEQAAPDTETKDAE